MTVGFSSFLDLHLGITNKMGLRRPSPEEEAREICERISLARRETGAPSLIVLGDLKHGLFESTVHEKKALRGLAESLAKDFGVWVMKGNHDYGIEECMDRRIKIIERVDWRLMEPSSFTGIRCRGCLKTWNPMA